MYKNIYPTPVPATHLFVDLFFAVKVSEKRKNFLRKKKAQVCSVKDFRMRKKKERKKHPKLDLNFNKIQ